MGFRINTNINAIDTQRNLMMTSMNMATTMRRLSSGMRINSAADDAAGLAIGQKLTAQFQGLNQAVRNAQDGISLVQTAEGALNETQSILQRMRQLAVQSANDTNTSTDRSAIQSEMNQLATEMSRISNTTSFNTKNLLAGGFTNQSLQIGANQSENMSFGITAMDAATLGVAANGAMVSATQNTANINSIANVGKGFNNGVNYAIKSTAVTAGSLSDANGASGKGVTQSQNIGNEQLNAEGAFAGTVATNYSMRVSGLDAAGVVNQMQYSTDGGSSWATSNGQIQKDGSYAFQTATSSSAPGVDSALVFKVSLPTTGAVGAAIGDQFAFTANPAIAASATGYASAVTTFAAPMLSAGSIVSAQGNYTGSLSGTVNITLGNITGTTASTVAVSIGGQSIGSNATATYGAGVADVQFNGLSYRISGITGAGGGTNAVSYSFGNLTPVSNATQNNQFAAAPAATLTSASIYAKALTAAGGALAAPSTQPTVVATGAYTGATGSLVLTAGGTDWTLGSTPTAQFISSTGAATAVALSAANYTGGATGSATAAGTFTFTYQGAAFTVTGGALNAASVAGDTMTIGVQAAATTGNMTVATTANAGASTATTAAQNVGNESLNAAGFFQGTSTTNYLMQVTSVSNNQVTGAKFSTDGGTTWATASATPQGNGAYTFQAQRSSTGGTTGSGGDSGMVYSFTTPTNGVTPQVNDQFSFQAVASNAPATVSIAANGTGALGTTSAAVTGTYTGPYAGAVNIASTVSASAGIPSATVPTVKIGNTTLDASQIVYSAATSAGGSSTLSFLGLTYTYNVGAAATATAAFNITGQSVTAASNAQSANLAGATSVTTANNSGTAAAVTTATATQLGVGIPGLGSGSILLMVKDFNKGSLTGTSSYGINNVAWLEAGQAAKVGGTFQTAAHSTDFSYNGITTQDSYSAGSAYGGTASVTGADGSTYKIVVSNSTTAGASVSIQNATNTKTYATYNVSLGSVTGAANANDVIALNLNQGNVLATGTQNVGSETASISGTYTGTANTQFTAKIAQTDANGNVSQIQMSSDGGKTYGSAISANTPYSSPSAFGTVTSFNLGNGLTFTATPGQFNQNRAVVNDTFTFTAMATTANGGTGSDMLQLQYTDTTANKTYSIGSSQLLQNNQNSATLGTATMNLTANFSAVGTSGGVTAGTTTITSQGSQAAAIGAGGVITSNATAYAGLDVTTQTNAQSAISVIDAAINTVSLVRAQLGAVQNRLTHTIANLSVGSENLNAAQSRIMDVDIASETVNMTKNQILNQAGISVLAQANQQPQSVMKLLQ